MGIKAADIVNTKEGVMGYNNHQILTQTFKSKDLHS